MPEFSVIIPLYNKTNYVEKTIESVLRQSFEDYEIIVVDDCSTDDGFSKVGKFDDSRIKLFRHARNKGLSATRNTAISNAKGSIIALLDADDIWKPEHLENIFILKNKYAKATIYGTNWIQKIGNTFLEPIRNIPSEPEHLFIDDFWNASLYEPLVCPSSLAFKKEVINRIGGFDELIQVGEDTDFLIRTNLKYGFAYHNTASCIYTVFSENQITTGNLGTKKLPDFNSFEEQNPKNFQLKRFLDIQRYTYALKYKEEESKEFSKICRQINLKNLNKKQRFLMKSPRWIYKILKKIKVSLLKKSVRITSF